MINRRKFIKIFSTLFATIPLVLLARKKQKGFKLTTLKVAGLQYGNSLDIVFDEKNHYP